MPEGPDFLCIGMQKAGTEWLYGQLQYHPDFWMPPVKELHYLNKTVSRMNNPKRVLKRWKKVPEKLSTRTGWRRPLKECDIQFLQEAAACAGEPRDIARYATLFRFKNGLLSGDVTPAYSTLEDDIIAEIAEKLPDVKIIFLVREPLDRAWSQVCMAARNDKFENELLKDPAAFRDFIKSKNIDTRSFPTKILAGWRRNAPNVALKYFLLDDIIAEPEGTRASLLTFLGADPNKTSGMNEAGHNRKANSTKIPLTDGIREVMVEHFRQEIIDCANVFGGRATEWPKRYGL